MTSRPHQLIKWPTIGPRTGLHDTGEGGIWTYLFYPVAYDIAPADAGLPLLTDPDATVVSRQLDPLVRCHGVTDTLALPLPDSLIRDDGMLYPGDEEMPPYVGPTGSVRAREDYLAAYYAAGSSILGAVLLGSTVAVYADAQGVYWAPTRKDLTRAGRRLVRHLDACYDRLGWLVTYLDT